jgi:hypothetical protein
MIKTSFDHDWRGLWQMENDTYLYRQEEWGDRLFPSQFCVLRLA